MSGSSPFITRCALILHLALCLGGSQKGAADPSGSQPQHGPEGYFDGTAFTILKSTLDIRHMTSLGFRTCSQGLLFYQPGAGGDSLKLELTPSGGLSLQWKVSGTDGSVEVGQRLNDNQWHQILLRYSLGTINLTVDNSEVMVANASYHSELLRLDLRSPNPEVVVGQGFQGCLLQGAGLVFNDDSVTSVGVNWTLCPLPNRGHCDGYQMDYCFSQPCHKHGACISLSDEYRCECTARYTGINCEIDTGPLCERIEYNQCQNGGICQEDKTGNGTSCACPPKVTGQFCERLIDGRLCDTNPCRNNATCHLNQFGDGYECACLSGFAGTDCEIDINECSSSPCQHSGICVDGIDSYACKCLGTGYRGQHCEVNIDECVEDDPCFNSGRCFDTYGGYFCECPLGFTGRNCEKEVNECSSAPCKHGATCQNLLNRYQCICLQGFQGTDCEVNIDDCVDVYCPKHAQCQDGIHTYECICADGFTGVPPNCTDIDECSSSPCQSGGTCHDGQGSFSCSCPVGFSGPTCEEAIDECASSPCLGGGTCIDGVGTYTCQCPKGLVGPNCSRDLKECLSSPCLHGGQCIEKEGSFECNCTKGWSGRFCEYDVDECETASCQNGGRCEDEIAGYKCHCPQPWNGPNCEVNSKPCASPRACLNNGTCIDHRNGNYSCRCLAGFSGARCEVDLDDCVSDPCMNGGTCEDRPGGFHCHCPDEFGGLTCSAPYDACDDAPCHNGATCRSTPPHRNFTCECAMGFSGDRCEIDEDDCLGVSCPAGQVCFDLSASHRCGCPLGYEGDACDQEINECAAGPCHHGGTCVDGVGNATCLCPTGFRGSLCEHDVDECSEGGRSPCFSGICQNTVGSFQCWCRPGYTGTLCDQEYNECLVQPCRNGGTCRDLVANYKCLCPLGYAGKDCEIDVNECATQPCLNNATCLDEVGRFECRCLPGFAGILCEEDVDECASSPCLNGGQCHDRVNGFDCNCTDTGFSGPFCEVNIDDCASSPCIHESNCTDLVKDYSCACHPGFQGKNCESDVPECSMGPCQNGGECLEKSNHTIYQLDDYYRPPGFPAGPYTYATAGGYLCLCLRGFTGTDCEVNIDDCASSPCHNGTCIDGIDAYDCECLRGFEGRHCETEIDECRRFRPCATGSTCVDRIGDYQCRCPPGIGGKNCTVELRGCDQNDCENGATCVPYLLNETTHARNCSCPHGFYGPTCQFPTAMSFANDTHRLAVMGNSSHDYTLSLRFRTTLSDQLLAFGYGSSSLYYLLFLEDGLLRLWIQMSRSETTQLSFDQKTNNGQWWGLQLGFVTLGVNFTLDSGEKIWTTNQTVDFGGVRPTMTSTMIGGKDSWMRPAGGGDLPNFVGCMEDVEISGGMVVPGVEMAAAGVSSITYMGQVITGCVRTEQCFPSTCNGGGKCVDLWTAYSCSCFRPYFGLHCEHEFEAITFGHENSTESLVKVDITPAERQRLRNNATVSLFVRTRQSDGLIFYLGNGDLLDGAHEDDTFLAAEWESGVLRVSVKINGTPESLIDKLGRRLDDGYYHFLQVSLVNRTLSASINGTSLFDMGVEASQARYLEAKHLYLGGLPSSHLPLLESEHQDHHHAIRRQIPTPSVITVPQSLPPSFMLPTAPHVVKVPFFKGVMQDVRVNDWMVEVFESSEEVEPFLKLQGNVTKRNVLRGVRSDDACRADPCQNGSNCTVTWNDYFCHCATGFRGKKCTELEFCASNKCPVNSECHSLSHGYECIANATFNGINSSIHYTPRLEPGLQFQSLSFYFRSQHGGPILYLSRGFLSLNVTLIGSSELKIESEEKGSGTRIPLDLTDDGKWHFVNVTFGAHSLRIQVDSRELGTTNVTAAWSLNQLLTPEAGDAFDEVQIVMGGSDSHYRGCLREVRLGDLLLPFFLRSELSNDSSVNYFAATAVENVKADECQLCYDDECQHNSMCLDRHEHFHCNCSRGYEGQFCETDIDECAGILCEHGGTCVDGIGAFTCHCIPGYQGDLCDSEVDECESSPCLHGGTCIDQLNAYSCTCDTNYTGINCEKEKPFDCSSNPCSEGATCVNTPTSTLMGVRFECHCPIGRTGHICESEIDYCSADPCYNDATCINEPGLGQRRCICQRGFEGDDCLLKTDYCKHSPCYHRGTCSSHDEGYSCSCTAGYTGKQCEQDINECTIVGEDPCGTWGTCNNTDGGFECLCPIKYIGYYCNVTNPCYDEMACPENDVCSPSWFNDTYATPNCTCQGSSCKKEPDSGGTNVATLGIVVGSVVAATILIIIGVMTVFLTMAKKKRATRGTYSPSRQEMFGSRVEMGHVIKPPPEERLI